MPGSLGASMPRIDKSYIDGFKRERILEAAARLVMAKGSPEGAKVYDLSREAGVGRKTFYDLLEDKQHCLEQALVWSGHKIRSSVEDGSLDARLTSLLAFLAEHPEHVCLQVVHGRAISVSIFEANQKLFADLFEGAPETTAYLLVGGIEWTLARHLIETPAADPRLLLNTLRDFVQAHYRPANSLAVAA